MATEQKTDQSELNRESTPFTLFEAHEEVRKGVVRKRTLLYDFNSLADFEQEMGMGFAQLMQNKATFATARALVWSGLKHEDRALTIESCGKLMGKAIHAGEADVNDFMAICLTACTDQGALGPNVKRAATVPEGPPTPRPAHVHSLSLAAGSESTEILDAIPVEPTGSDGPHT